MKGEAWIFLWVKFTSGWTHTERDKGYEQLIILQQNNIFHILINIYNIPCEAMFSHLFFTLLVFSLFIIYNVHILFKQKNEKKIIFAQFLEKL